MHDQSPTFASFRKSNHESVGTLRLTLHRALIIGEDLVVCGEQPSEVRVENAPCGFGLPSAQKIPCGDGRGGVLLAEQAAIRRTPYPPPRNFAISR